MTWNFLAFDPDDRTNDYAPGDLFKDGVTVGASVVRDTRLAGRKTTFSVVGLYGTAEGTDYSSVGGAAGTTTRSGSYGASFWLRHELQESREHPDASWGLYLRAAIGDGNPNYLERSLILGISGKALFFGRPQDSFGLGATLLNVSDTLQDSLTSQANLQDEGVMEAFYSWEATPWLHVGADVQYVNPARGDNDKALIGALRVQIRF